MNDKWSEELRRAYDRGYWDARREFEHHLRHSHSDTIRDSRVSEGFMGEAKGERGGQQRYRGGEHDGSRGRAEGRRDDRGGYGRRAEEHGGRGSYGSGQSSWGGRGEGYRDSDRERHRDYPSGQRYSDEQRPDRHERGFFERIGDEVSSWFDGDDRRHSDFSHDYDRDVTGYRRR